MIRCGVEEGVALRRDSPAAAFQAGHSAPPRLALASLRPAD
jgi:hypothetical protein